MEFVIGLWYIALISFIVFFVLWIVALIKKNVNVMIKWSNSMLISAAAMNILVLIKNLI